MRRLSEEERKMLIDRIISEMVTTSSIAMYPKGFMSIGDFKKRWGGGGRQKKYLRYALMAANTLKG